MIYQPVPLGYSFDSLEPYIDRMTMETHYTKHYQGYIDNLNKVLEKYPELQDKRVEDLLKNLSSLSIENSDKTAIKNHGGGYMNHTLYWQIMGTEKEINEELVNTLKKEYGSVEKFKEILTQSAISHFGSGWAWLVTDINGKYQVYSTANQDSPYLKGHTPVIGLDVWEHAYYLKYKNKRAEYIENWFNVLKII